MKFMEPFMENIDEYKDQNDEQTTGDEMVETKPDLPLYFDECETGDDDQPTKKKRKTHIIASSDSIQGKRRRGGQSTSYKNTAPTSGSTTQNGNTGHPMLVPVQTLTVGSNSAAGGISNHASNSTVDGSQYCPNCIHLLHNEDSRFLLSLLPTMQALPVIQKFEARIEIEKAVLKALAVVCQDKDNEDNDDN